jgi:hypothetical protein
MASPTMETGAPTTKVVGGTLACGVRNLDDLEFDPGGFHR